MLVNLLVWVSIGILAGGLANRLAHGAGLGLALNALIGAIGALVGAFTMSLLLPQHIPLTTLSWASVAAALVASTLFLGIARLTTRRHNNRPNSTG